MMASDSKALKVAATSQLSHLGLRRSSRRTKVSWSGLIACFENGIESMSLLAIGVGDSTIAATDSEETFFKRLQVRKVVPYTRIAEAILLISGPAAIFSYGDLPRPILGYVFILTALASITVKRIFRRWLNQHRHVDFITLLLSMLYLVPAAGAMAVRPEEEAGRAIVVVGVACSSYCFTLPTFALLQVGQAVASVVAWYLADRTYGVDEFLIFFLAVPAVGFIVYECQLRSLRHAFRSHRETLQRQHELEVTLQQLTAETELRHEEERLRRESEARLKEQQDQLVHVSRLTTMGELVAGIAHELHQPLHATSMYAGVLDALAESNETVVCGRLHELTGKIVGLTQQSAATVRRLQNFVRRGPRVRVRSDLKELIRDALELMATEVRHMGVRVALNLPEAGCFIWADSVQIQQVIVNLVRNACEAMASVPQAQREINISVTETPDGYEMLLTDTGIGIPPEKLAKVFAPFESTKSEGMGMGLAISRSILEDHGGLIELAHTSQAGTTFRLLVPMPANEARLSV